MAVTSVGTTTTTPSTTSTSTTTASSSSGTGTLSAAGVGSGLDVKGLISQLMAVEQKPLNLLAQQETGLQAKLTSLGTVKGAFASLQSAAQTLSSASPAAFNAIASDPAILRATAGSDAIPGSSFSINVTQLAQAQKLVAQGKTDPAASIGIGTSTTVSFTFGTITGTPSNGTYPVAPATTFTENTGKTTVSVTIDSSNNTLAGIRDAINASNAGVSASIIKDGSNTPYRLVLTPDDSGAANSLKIAVSGDSDVATLLAYDPEGTQNLTQSQVAQNAKLSVDGIEIQSSTNSVADAIQGVSLDLTKKTSADTPITLTVQRDTSGLSTALSAFVKAYNTADSTANGVISKGAVLQGDWSVLTLQRRVRNMLGSRQEVTGAYSMLSQLGVSFQKDGTLVLDSSKLNAALSAAPNDVSALTLAIGSAVNTEATQLLGTSGPIANGTNGILRSINDIYTRRNQLQLRLDVVQKRYQAQFSALDTMLSSMSKTSSFLTQQLDNLPKLGTYA